MPVYNKINACISVIKRKGLVVCPTETSYMLAGLAADEAVIDAVRRWKRSPFNQPISIAVAGVEEAGKWARWNELADRMARKFWPGPLTLVLPDRGLLPTQLTAGTGWLGMRCSAHPCVAELLAGVGAPLTATSANRHGGPEPYNTKRMAPEESGVCVIDFGTLPAVPPSTVVRVRSDKIEILREGAIKSEDLLQFP